ncbi:hypothetical protein C0389_01700 [bacterium]|nr:hypothetical protein [bacterium]
MVEDDPLLRDTEIIWSTNANPEVVHVSKSKIIIEILGKQINQFNFTQNEIILSTFVSEIHTWQEILKGNEVQVLFLISLRKNNRQGE